MLCLAAALALSTMSTTLTPDQHAEATLAKMTLDDKLSLLGGHDSMWVLGNERLGIPTLKMSDGPAGVRCWGETTAYPAPISLAASFNKDLAAQFGKQIGRDCRARGTHIWLGPGVNLARVPQCGRNFEYFGEDPFLTSRMAVNVIEGVQSQGVAATIKHFVANDHEIDRNNDDSIVDETTLRELYMLPFEAAVKEAGVKCLMSGYNLTNGHHMSAQDHLINQVLKQEWGFKGVHMSDWEGTHETLGAAMGGLDLEMPSAKYMSPANLKPLIDAGTVPMSLIDDKIKRYLTLIYEMEWDKRDQHLDIPLNDPSSDAVALQIAREGIVLLQNNNSLPLEGKKHIVVVGPNAKLRNIGGGGSAYTEPFSYTTIFDALVKEFEGKATFEYVATQPIEENALSLPRVHAEYFDNQHLQGAPKIVREEKAINFNWGPGSPDSSIPGDHFSARFTLTFAPPKAGRYAFIANSDDGMRVFLDDKLILDDWSDHAVRKRIAFVPVSEGEHKVRVEYYENMGEAIAKFAIAPVLEPSPELANKIKNADAVIACMGWNMENESEGNDRTFALPTEQTDLLDTVTKIRHDAILVVNSGGASELARWADKLGAIVQSWYPGQNGNIALAEILSGKTNPSGKLPVSFPRTFKGTYYETAYPAVDNKMPYTEGFYMGYRWFDKNQVKPLFAFGHGLSYSKFELGKLRSADGGYAVEVTNTSDRDGATSIQFYAGAPRQLKGFARVELKAHETKDVHVALDPRAFERWNKNTHRWETEHGPQTIAVGFSSDDIRLTLEP